VYIGPSITGYINPENLLGLKDRDNIEKLKSPLKDVLKAMPNGMKMNIIKCETMPKDAIMLVGEHNTVLYKEGKIVEVPNSFFDHASQWRSEKI